MSTSIDLNHDIGIKLQINTVNNDLDNNCDANNESNTFDKNFARTIARLKKFKKEIQNKIQKLKTEIKDTKNNINISKNTITVESERKKTLTSQKSLQKQNKSKLEQKLEQLMQELDISSDSNNEPQHPAIQRTKDEIKQITYSIQITQLKIKNVNDKIQKVKRVKSGQQDTKNKQQHELSNYKKTLQDTNDEIENKQAINPIKTINEYIFKLLSETNNVNYHSLEDYIDSEGNTFLHIAIKHDQKEIVKYLLNNTNIDVNAKNTQDQTALDLANHYCNNEIVALIKNKQNYVIEQNNANNSDVNDVTSDKDKEVSQTNKNNIKDDVTIDLRKVQDLEPVT